MLVLTLRRTRTSDRAITGILALFWVWTGIVFFLPYFAKVYIPAYAFGVIFIIHGVLLVADLFRPRLSYHYQGGALALVGLILITYATVGYPLVGSLMGHEYPQSPPFGLTPYPPIDGSRSSISLFRSSGPSAALFLSLWESWRTSAPSSPVSCRRRCCWSAIGAPWPRMRDTRAVPDFRSRKGYAEPCSGCTFSLRIAADTLTVMGLSLPAK